ncbi:MAG: 50S ribosomal protein L32 [Desulfotignum sp.]
MAVPKQKSSKARGRKRRTHYKTQAPTVTVCPECQEAKLPHTACPECGAYKDRNVKSEDDA